ncbi:MULTISPECIES: multidrug effflux MFS transporter [Cohaesibacter]|uniref:multidrug effflux MFS transporter n=1 Tax=Cohaesibacter TaxID=655352 RepID=UPI000DEA42A6|nr:MULTISPECIES: multidrug effflux MFS transporter [Cohaesibacter]TLP45691.1 multidrug effflux MFS transporter [Cohaesibacter sp. CAU 1516]
MQNKATNSVDDLSEHGQIPSSKAVEPNLAFGEFIVLMALLMSLVALSIDGILPALKILGPEMGETAPQQLQKVITFLFAGLAIGQMIYGPISDQIGRKKSIYIGLTLFFVGSVISWASVSFDQLLLGRFLQGLGAAGPRIVLIALVRDLYAGRTMARVMSFVMGVFIFVPVIAPIMGQTVAQLAGWRSIFFCFMILCVISGLWLMVRQKETLLPSKRRKLTPSTIWQGIKIVLTTPSCVGYMIATGIVMGPFLLYLSTSQDLFQNTYHVGDLFPYFFAALALSIGVASFSNSKLVMRFGMRFLARTALSVMVGLTALALLVSAPNGFVPPLWLFMLLFSPLFFCMGLLFGNMNALAMEEVGHVAGMGSAVVGSVSTIIAMLLASLLGLFYDGTIITLAASFMCCGALNLVIIWITERLRSVAPA